MDFFVPQQMEETQSSKESNPVSNRLDLIILSNAKHIGLSFQELNQLRVSDFIEMTDIHLGKKKVTGSKRATQADIDKLFA
ncbi:hypothetical protein [Orenia metallireducens]|nr:hypothetical protein [Orenia metallireducens]